MLELIVLGQVPGTQFTITFVQVLLVALAFLVIAWIVRETDQEQSESQLKKRLDSLF